jgi:DNA-binding CsgD family transcriptional regulator
VLTPAQIRDGLHDRFKLLTGGARTSTPRQQTLQASVDWSYALLLDAERVVLDRLSVFAGTFTLAAAEAVCAGGSVESHHVFDLVSALVDKSLVIAGSDGRFSLLETVREYAAATLADAGDAPTTPARHFEHYVDVATWRRRVESEDAFSGRVSLEYENIRRALQWAEDEDDPATLFDLTRRLYGHWTNRRLLRDGVHWSGRAATRARELTDLGMQARALAQHVSLCGFAGTGRDSWPLSVEAAETARRSGDRKVLLWTLLDLGGAFMAGAERDSDTGHTINEWALEATSLAEELGDEAGRAYALLLRAQYFHQLDPGAAFDLYCEAWPVADAAGFDSLRRYAEHGMAAGRLWGGVFDEGIERLERARAALAESRSATGYRTTVKSLAILYAWQGRMDDVDRCVTELTDLLRETHDDWTLSDLAECQVWALLGRARWSDARELLESHVDADPRFARIGRPLLALTAMAARDVDGCAACTTAVRADGIGVNYYGELLPLFEAFVALARGVPNDAEPAGRKLVEQVHRVGAFVAWRFMALQLVAAIETELGGSEAAVRILAAIEAQARAVGLPTDTPLWSVAELGAGPTLRARLGDSRFAELWEEGVRLDRDELLAYVLRGQGERKRPKSGWASITPTEQQVIDLVASGATNKEIAARLFITVATVKSHLNHVFTKLGLSSRGQLTAEVVRRSRGQVSNPSS